MKWTFFGDVMFGRQSNPFVDNPWKKVLPYLLDTDILFFNLETSISNIPEKDKYPDKVFNYQAGVTQLVKLKQLLPKTKIVVSTANNHTLDYGRKGLKQTLDNLKSLGIITAGAGKNIDSASSAKFIKPNIYFLSTTDHCGCLNINKWKATSEQSGLWITDILGGKWDSILKKVENLSKKGEVVVSCHWGSNWTNTFEMKNAMNNFAKILIDYGAKVVFGHSAHHMLPVERYNNGLIIYGLGDFVNDYAINREYRSDLCSILRLDTNSLQYEIIPIIKMEGIPSLSNNSDAQYISKIINCACSSTG